MSAPAAARFTPGEIAEAVAKRVARVGDFDDNIATAFARHGIELDDDGFTLIREGQTFRLTVTEQVATPAAPPARAWHRADAVPNDVGLVQDCFGRTWTRQILPSEDGGPQWRLPDARFGGAIPAEVFPVIEIPSKSSCCFGPFADGSHSRSCWQKCQDCGGYPSGPLRCRCRDDEPTGGAR